MAEALAMLVEFGAVQIVVQIGNPTAGAGIGESRDEAAPPVNGPALPPLDGKVGAETQQDVGVDVRGEVELLG